MIEQPKQTFSVEQMNELNQSYQEEILKLLTVKTNLRLSNLQLRKSNQELTKQVMELKLESKKMEAKPKALKK